MRERRKEKIRLRLRLRWLVVLWVSIVGFGLSGAGADAGTSTSTVASVSSSGSVPSPWFRRDRGRGGSSATTSTTTSTSHNSLPRSSIPRSFTRQSKSSYSSSSSSSSSSSQQQSNHHHHRLNLPPWNLSNQIDENGFLKRLYARIPGDWEPEMKLRTCHTCGSGSGNNKNEQHNHNNNNNNNQYLTSWVKIRQVPGDGNCLFHSISLCLRHAVNGTHWNICSSRQELEDLLQFSHHLRLQAVHCLSGGTTTTTTSTSTTPSSSTYSMNTNNHNNNNKRLFLQGRETLKARELVQAAAQQYQMTAEEYCDCMSQPSVWGGGPEIVALCNLLKRPIHVYELAAQGDDFLLRRMACFGSPKFDSKLPLHILSADSRFPDIQPGQQLSAGNHFLAVFPLQRRRRRLRRKKQQQQQQESMRGGGGGGIGARLGLKNWMSSSSSIVEDFDHDCRLEDNTNDDDNDNDDDDEYVWEMEEIVECKIKRNNHKFMRGNRGAEQGEHADDDNDYEDEYFECEEISSLLSLTALSGRLAQWITQSPWLGGWWRRTAGASSSS